jgi:energy-coupling factor transporter ATP-binding protein EcfA2
MMPAGELREDLYVPDRFEGLRGAGISALQAIVYPVDGGLKVIDARIRECRAARRGGFMLLRGNSGAGKSTFLDTIHLFRQGVTTHRIAAHEDVQAALESLGPGTARLVVLEGREALGEEAATSLEASLHAINSFLRTPAGAETLVVWPTNTDALTQQLEALATAIGAEAMFGTGDRVTQFSGPPKAEYVGIAERTVGALNEGASLAALGISEALAQEITQQADTVGRYLGLVREALLRNDDAVGHCCQQSNCACGPL